MSSADQGLNITLPANTATQIPVPNNGVTLINQNSTIVMLSTNENMTNAINLLASSSLPWPGGGTLWASSSVTTNIIVIQGTYNYSAVTLDLAQQGIVGASLQTITAVAVSEGTAFFNVTSITTPNIQLWNWGIIPTANVPPTESVNITSNTTIELDGLRTEAESASNRIAGIVLPKSKLEFINNSTVTLVAFALVSPHA